MMFYRRACLLFALPSLALTSATVLAQIAVPTSGTPLVPSYDLHYRSTFQGYQAYQVQKIESWKAANDTAKDIGGWRVYAREGAQAEPAPTNAAPTLERPPNPSPSMPEKVPAPHRHQPSASPQGVTK